MNIKNIFKKLTNIQFLGLFKVGDYSFNPEQFENLLNNNIQWKNFINYKQGQICSYKKGDNGVSFYMSVSDNNKGNVPPTTTIYNNYWRVINTFEYGNQEHNLIFKIPYIQQQANFYIQFSSSANFSDLTPTTINTNDDSDLFLKSNSTSGEIGNIPLYDNQAKLTNEDSYEILILNIAQFYENYKYFRYRWQFVYEEKENYSKYFFGDTSGVLQVFSTQEDDYLVVDFHDDNLTGKGTQDSPLNLNKNITIDSITNDDTFTINAINSIDLNSIDLKFNNNGINSAGGILTLNDNRQIDSSFVEQAVWDKVSDVLPNKNSVSTKDYGNPLTVKIKDSQTIQNNDSTILLYQTTKDNPTSENQAIGQGFLKIIDESNFMQLDGDYFKHGIKFYTVDQHDKNLSSSIFQISFELLLSDIEDLVSYQNVFSHSLNNGELCRLEIKKDYFKFWVGSYCLFADEVQSYKQNYKTLKFVFMYSNCNLNVYCNAKHVCDGNYYLPQIIYCDLNNPISFAQAYYGRWNFLKCDLVIKELQYEKVNGQLYTENVDPQEIIFDYTLQNGDEQFSNQYKNAVLFGKVGEIPCYFSYPNIQYVLPIANHQKLGGVKIGSGLKISPNGVLSVVGNGVDGDILASYVAKNNISVTSSYQNADFKFMVGNTTNEILDGGLLLLSGNKHICLAVKANITIDEHFSVVSGIEINENKIQFKLNNENSLIVNENGFQLNGGKLSFNGNEQNTPNGILVLDENGKIDNDFLNLKDPQGFIINNRISILNSQDVKEQYGAIKQGNGVEFVKGEDDAVVLNVTEIGVRRDDLAITPNLLVKTQNGRYVFVVNNATLGSFVVKDYVGKLIYPSQRQIEKNVQIDLTQWVTDGVFKDGGTNYTVVFVRGEKGNDGQVTQQQVMNLILTYLF